MVRQAVLWSLLWASCAAFGGQLTATLDHRESLLGEPLLLRVEARGEATLEKMDLSPLASDFEIFAVTHTSQGEGKSARSRLEATLYPLREGTLRIPPLNIGQTVSKALQLEVRADPDLTLQARLTPNTLHERQQATLVVDIRDHADRQWARPGQLEVPGLLLRPLAEMQREEGEGPDRITVREFRWSILALKADHYTVKLPMLDTYRLGTRLRLPPPSAALEVRALPSYLPVAVPIGKPVLEASVETSVAASRAVVGQPFRWSLRIRADGVTADGLRQLLRLPQGEQDGLRFYPAEYALEEDKTTGMNTLTVAVPVSPLRAGQVPLPALTLPYFDPQTQRMEQARVAATSLAVSDPFWQRVAIAAASLLGLIVAGVALRAGHGAWQRRRTLQAALAKIAQAADAPALAQAVCRFSSAPYPATLRQWLARVPERRPLPALVDELEQACFATQPGPGLPALKQRWLAALKGQRII